MLRHFMISSTQKKLESGWFILNNDGPYIHLIISEKLHLADKYI